MASHTIKLCHDRKCDVIGDDQCVCGHDMYHNHINGHPHPCAYRGCGCEAFAEYAIPAQDISSAIAQLKALL